MPEFVTTESQDAEFRNFLGKGEVRLQKCRQCGRLRAPARWVCPECLSEDYDWTPISGAGEVECFTWYMQPFDPRFTDVPYNVALVRLAEGPRVIANVLGVAPGELAVGQGVQAAITEGMNKRPALNFRPVG